MKIFLVFLLILVLLYGCIGGSRTTTFIPVSQTRVIIDSNSDFNGTVQYLKDLSTTCYADYNLGVVMQVRGVGCP